MDDLLNWPHHDGSPLYVANDSPSLGDLVTVRLRVPGDVDAVHLRTVEDGEPFFYPCELTRRDGQVNWWSGTVPVRNPLQRYRFLVEKGDSYVTLNQAGVFERDTPDCFDFVLSAHQAAPDWGRDAIIYQIFPDRFARSSAADERAMPSWAVPADWSDPPIHVGPDTPLQFYGGDLDGIIEHLDHVVSLGIDTVYLTPVFPGESNHRYNASTFDRVDDLLGGDAAYRRLIDAAHERGLKVLGDLTSNHTGDTHEWFVNAVSDPSAAERSMYYFDEDGNYEGWKGHATLPKLNHLDNLVGDRIDAVVRRWLDFGIDGWRIDVANMTGRFGDVDVAHEVAQRIRNNAVAAAPNALIVGEHGHDASEDLDGAGWHGTMNYYGFSYPVWEFTRREDGPVPSFGRPLGLPRRNGTAFVETVSEFLARFGWRSFATSWNILGSHDSPRIRTITGTPERHRIAIALQFTLPGVPMIFAGDEFGQLGVDGEDSRKTMTWGQAPMADYAEFSALRREHVSLRRGGLRWLHVEDDRVIFAREHPEETALVVIARDRCAALQLPASALGTDQPIEISAATGPSASVQFVNATG